MRAHSLTFKKRKRNECVLLHISITLYYILFIPVFCQRKKFYEKILFITQLYLSVYFLLLSDFGYKLQQSETAIIATEIPEETPTVEEPTDLFPGFTSVDENVYAKANVNIRKGPGTEYEKIGLLNQGTSIKRIGIGNNGWSKVVYQGNEAYISSNYLTVEKPSQTTLPINTEPSDSPATESPAVSENEKPSSIPSVPEGSTSHVHDYSAVRTVPPSCIEEGYTTYACTCGDTYRSDIQSPVDHTWSDWNVTKEATSTEEGKQERNCSVCGVSESKTIAKTEQATVDTSAIASYGCAYAQSLGFIVDYSLGGGNAGYLPGLSYPIASTEEGYTHIAGCVAATRDQLIAANGTIEGCRISCYVEYSHSDAAGDWYIFWCYYG